MHLVQKVLCVCHLANLCLQAGVKVLPIDVDVDLFYYFDKSAKRKEFHEFQEFTDTKKLKIIKHCKTCWLSLEKVVQRVLQQWCPFMPISITCLRVTSLPG